MDVVALLTNCLFEKLFSTRMFLNITCILSNIFSYSNKIQRILYSLFNNSKNKVIFKSC